MNIMPDSINPPASTYQPILDALKGRDSKNTITLALVQAITGMHLSTLNQLVNEMYERGMINKALQIKNGVEDLLLWPIGVIKPYNDYGVNAKRTPPSHSITISKRPLEHKIKIDGFTLAEPISTQLADIDLLFSALHTISAAMPEPTNQPKE